MRIAGWLLLGILLVLAAPISAQTLIVHINRRAAYNVGLVDLNTATKDELMTLPSIGEAEAQRIMEGRLYDSKQRLLDSKILTQKIYEAIEKRVTTLSGPPKG